MKKALIVPVMLALMSGQASALEPMKLNYSNFAPFSWKNTEGRMRGIFIDIHNEALGKRMGISVRHAEYPWKRAQYLVRRGEADAFTTVPTPERREYTEISGEALLVSDMILFANKENPKISEFRKIRRISDLRGFKLMDYIGNGWAEKNLAGLDVSWGDNIRQILKALATGRGDLFIHPVHVTDYNIKELGLQGQIMKIHNVMESVPFNLCVGKKSSYVDILPKFDETIRGMRKDGTLGKICDTYR